MVPTLGVVCVLCLAFSGVRFAVLSPISVPGISDQFQLDQQMPAFHDLILFIPLQNCTSGFSIVTFASFVFGAQVDAGDANVAPGNSTKETVNAQLRLDGSDPTS